MSREHKYADARIRALGVLALDRGTPSEEVAIFLNVSHQSVYNWAQWWRESGVMGLLGGHAGGRPPKLTPEMIEFIKETAKSGPLSASQIRRALLAQFVGLEIGLTATRDALNAAGLTSKRARESVKKT